MTRRANRSSMKHQTVLYLSHPFSCRKAVLKWQPRVEEATGLKLLNPFYDTYEKETMLRVDANKMKLWQVHQSASLKERQKIVAHDTLLITKSDGVLLYAPRRVAVGTWMEAWYAKSIGKPVYTITYQKAMSHPWIEYVSASMFPSVRAFVRFWQQT